MASIFVHTSPMIFILHNNSYYYSTRTFLLLSHLAYPIHYCYPQIPFHHKVPSGTVITTVKDKGLMYLFSAVEDTIPCAFNQPVLAPSLYVPNSQHQSSLLPGDVSIRGRQSSVASRRKKGSSRQDTNPIKLFLYWLLGTGNKQWRWSKGDGDMLNTYCSNTQNRACHQEFPLTLPLPTDPLRSHLSSPFTDFMLQRGAPSLRHSPKKSSSISLESWLLIRELHFRCRRLFFPLF